jgi:hypothetical protein
MNWRLVALLSLYGVIMGIASVLGHASGKEALWWLVAAVVCAGIIAWREPARAFRHGFVVGTLGGMATPFIQALFFSTYREHNPQIVADLEHLPLGLGAPTFILLLSPATAAVNGVVLGLLSWIAGWAVIRSRAERVAA